MTAINRSGAKVGTRVLRSFCVEESNLPSAAGWQARSWLMMVAIAALLCLLSAVPATAGAASSLPDVAVTPNEPQAFQQPSLAVDPTDPDRLAVAFNEATDHKYCGVGMSRDGGQTWKVQRVAGQGAPFGLPPDFPQCWDPQLIYGRDGTLYYQYEPRPGKNPLGQRQVIVAVSRRGGPFEAPREVDPVGPGTDHTDLWASMAVDPRSGRFYSAFLRYCEPTGGMTTPSLVANCLPTPGKVVVASSGDGGRTYSPPVAATPPSIPDPARESVAVDGGGTVYAVYNDGFFGQSGSPPANFYVATSRDEGKSFGPPKQFAQLARCQGKLCYAPEANQFGFYQALGGGPNELFITWWDKRDGKYRILFSASRDGGDTFSPPRIVGIPPGGEGHEQHRPRLALGPDGRLYLAYYDLRPDDAYDVYLAESRDGGRSFATPRKLNDVPLNAKVGPPGSKELANFGLRLALTTSQAGPLTAWTDSRRGTPVSGKQDIFFEGQSLEAAGQGPAGGQGRRCVSTRGGIKGTGVGVARLGRTRARQRKILKGTLFSDRPKIDRYCVKKGGGSLRAGYPTRRLASKLSRRTRRRIGSKAILLVSTSKAFRLSRSKVGTRTRTLRRRLKGERRFKVGRNLWYVAKGRKVRLLFRTRKGKVLEMGIADKRLTTNRVATVRLLRAWDKRGKTRK